MAQTKSKTTLATRQFWQKHIENWEASELIQSEYCRIHQLKVHCFYYWKKKLSCTEETSLVQIPLARIFQSPIQNGTSSLRVAVDDKIKIEVEPGFDPATLRQIIQTLGGL